MKGKASDICPKCKHCEGSADMVEKSYYVCCVNHSNGGLYHLMPAEDELYCTAFEEANMNKIEGKVGDICPKCKNCKGITKESNGVHVWLTEVECEDPYDGMTKTLDADSNICCSMFEPKSDKSCEKCERFDGTYCHGSNGTITISYKAVFGEPVNCPSYEEKKGIEYEDPYYGLIREMSREALEAKILDLFKEKDKLNDIINKLEKEKAAHLKGIERLKNKNEKYLKKITDLNSKVEVLDRRNTNQCVMIGERDKEIENIKKMLERRDRWVKELQSDVYSLQNEILTIRDIAQKAYDDTNRD